MQYAARFGLAQRDVLANVARDGQRARGHAELAEQPIELLADGAAARVDGQHIGAQRMQPAGDIDAAAAGRSQRFRAARLARGLQVLGLGGQVERRVHGQGHDRGHVGFPAAQRAV
jgi:hypothetical protein